MASNCVSSEVLRSTRTKGSESELAQCKPSAAQGPPAGAKAFSVQDTANAFEAVLRNIDHLFYSPQTEKIIYLSKPKQLPEITRIGLADRDAGAVIHCEHKCRVGVRIDFFYMMDIHDERPVAADKRFPRQ